MRHQETKLLGTGQLPADGKPWLVVTLVVWQTAEESWHAGWTPDTRHGLVMGS